MRLVHLSLSFSFLQYHNKYPPLRSLLPLTSTHLLFPPLLASPTPTSTLFVPVRHSVSSVHRLDLVNRLLHEVWIVVSISVVIVVPVVVVWSVVPGLLLPVEPLNLPTAIAKELQQVIMEAP